MINMTAPPPWVMALEIGALIVFLFWLYITLAIRGPWKKKMEFMRNEIIERRARELMKQWQYNRIFLREPESGVIHEHPYFVEQKKFAQKNGLSVKAYIAKRQPRDKRGRFSKNKKKV